MTRPLAITLLLTGALLAAPLHASESEIGFEAGYFRMTASQSAQAVFGSKGSLAAGLSLGRPIGRAFFARLGGRIVSRSGEQVYVADPGAPVFRLGHPLSMRLIPISLLAGYRFRSARSLVPYLGAGVGLTLYRESSVIGGEETSDSQTRAALELAAGADLHRGRVRFGAEVTYSLVPGALGVGGVSAVYGEKDLGGLGLMGRVTFVP